jgi:hypothetical protein
MLNKQKWLLVLMLGLFLLLILVGATCVNAVPSPPPAGNVPSVSVQIWNYDVTSMLSQSSSLPLHTQGWVYYTYGNNNPSIKGTVTLEVYTGPTKDGPWTPLQTLTKNEVMTSGEGEYYPNPFSFDQVGYYQFNINCTAGSSVANPPTAIYFVNVGPVLSESATLATLGLCVAAVGAVLVRKKPAKQ